MNASDERFAYVDHMLAEHRHLDRILRRTLRTLPAWEEADNAHWLPHVAKGLEAIRDELAHHFHDEEQAGCLEEAVARCPALSADARKIERQHDELLEHLDELICRCQTTAVPTPIQAQALDQEFRQIVRELKLHEAQENHILQRGFNVCLNGDAIEPRPTVADAASVGAGGLVKSGAGSVRHEF